MSLRALTRTLLTTTTTTTTTTRTPITTRFFTNTSYKMGVQRTVLVEGSGPSPQKGDTVTMLYTGWLKEEGKKDGKGKQFDTTEKPGRGPFQTAIGVGRVIQGTYSHAHTHRRRFLGVMGADELRVGWDEGVVQMKLGEKARLDITSDYAYGSQ